MGSVDGKKAQRAIDCAIDCGILHFDLARSYGYGEAERFVGKVLGNKRKNLVLASKFGIEANRLASLLAPIKPVVRFGLSKVKWKDKKAAQGQESPEPVKFADRFHKRLPVTASLMNRSVEKSLRALKTDYLDILLVHEPLESICNVESLIEAADALRREGKIRAFGLSFMRLQQALHQIYLDKFDILQFDSAVGASGYEDVVRDRGSDANILFSPLRGGANDLKAADKLTMLAKDFPSSVILCSMFNEDHIKHNAALF